MTARICLIEDDFIMGESLVDRFSLEGFSVDWHQSGEAALPALRAAGYDAVISDVRLPDTSGEDVFRRVRKDLHAATPFFFITAYATVDRAVEMLKLGAVDYVTKPFDIGELVEKVRTAVGSDSLVIATPDEDAPLGLSPAMRALAGVAPRVATRARTVLISGESGAGKEVLARHLHRLGGASRPFVAVNCAAIPETLIEDTLFGHERGAFTGADKGVRGVFEQASGGVLFLDEIGDLPLPTQAKLLRAVQDRTVRRLGSERQVEVDVQLICATNVQLKERVAQGRFREDLFYRIAVVQLDVPPLRRRAEDVLWLADRFLDDLSASAKEVRRQLRPSAQAALLAHGWPGNVRELRNRIERALVFSDAVAVSEVDLFPEKQDLEPEEHAGWLTLEQYQAAAERSYLLSVLEAQGGRIMAAASVLGISRKTLWEKMRRHGLKFSTQPADSGPTIN